jgi:hypothetical protein
LVTTPLRLQKQGRVIGPQQLEARDLLVSLMRRVGLLVEMHHHETLSIHYTSLAQQAEQVSIEKQLQWFDWQRYSHRQQRAMKLGGVVGQITLRGHLAPWMPFLKVGERCHLGKNATFGLGQYSIKEINK